MFAVMRADGDVNGLYRPQSPSFLIVLLYANRQTAQESKGAENIHQQTLLFVLVCSFKNVVSVGAVQKLRKKGRGEGTSVLMTSLNHLRLSGWLNEYPEFWDRRARMKFPGDEPCDDFG